MSNNKVWSEDCLTTHQIVFRPRRIALVLQKWKKWKQAFFVLFWPQNMPLLCRCKLCSFQTCTFQNQDWIRLQVRERFEVLQDPVFSRSCQWWDRCCNMSYLIRIYMDCPQWKAVAVLSGWDVDDMSRMQIAVRLRLKTLGSLQGFPTFCMVFPP